MINGRIYLNYLPFLPTTSSINPKHMEAKDIKRAILRLFYDMINADGIIHDKEIKILEDLKKKYNISKDDDDGKLTYEAHTMTFSDALLKLKDWKKDKSYSYNVNLSKNKNKTYLYSVENIQKDLLSLAESDKNLSSLETLILLAYYYVVINESATCFSCLERNLRFSKKEIIYVESAYDKTINKEIQDNHTLISDKLKLHGFEFVYIPYEKDFLIKKNTDGLLEYAIRFIHPINVRDMKKVNILVDELKNVKTSEFIKWYFRKNDIGVSFLPSILVKLKKTRVAKEGTKTQYESYSDFIMISIKDSIIKTIDNFMCDYIKHLERFTCNAILSSNEMINGHGFHRTLLNYLVYKSFSGKVEELIINYEEKRNEYIEFKGIDQKCHLTSSEIAVYVIVLAMTYFKEYGGLCRDRNMIKENVLEKIQDMYSNISDKDDIYTSINSIVPKINSKIKHVNKLENFVDYQIENPRRLRNNCNNDLKYSLNINFDIIKFRFCGSDRKDIIMSFNEWIEQYWNS